MLLLSSTFIQNCSGYEIIFLDCHPLNVPFLRAISCALCPLSIINCLWHSFEQTLAPEILFPFGCIAGINSFPQILQILIILGCFVLNSSKLIFPLLNPLISSIIFFFFIDCILRCGLFFKKVLTPFLIFSFISKVFILEFAQLLQQNLE